MAENQLNRYLFENLSVRGELVQLSSTYEQIVTRQAYPEPIKDLLGELLVATTLLTATLKFEGSITLQIQGDGPVSLAVINGDNNQNVRGVARWKGNVTSDMTLEQMMGKGHLVITIEPRQGERYQGIVGLDAEHLTQVIEGYFERSEQLHTKLWIRTGEMDGKPHAAGMLLQVMPDGTGTPDDFDHLAQLTNTISNDELFSLPAKDLLYRLYHQEEVKIFEPQHVDFQCHCSRERSAAAIVTLPQEEIEDILEQENQISLHCDYCNTTYTFSAQEIQNLSLSNSQVNTTRH